MEPMEIMVPSDALDVFMEEYPWEGPELGINLAGVFDDEFVVLDELIYDPDLDFDLVPWVEVSL